MKPKNRIPRLRFPEFENEGEWEEKKLGNLVKIKSGNSPSKYQLYESGKYPFIKVEDLNNCEKYQATGRQYVNTTEDLIPKMSIIFPKRGAAIYLNKVRITQIELLVDTNTMAIIAKDFINPEFLYYTIIKIGLHKIADTSTIPQINNKHIDPFRLLTPQNPLEQQRIAACLSSLDELIASHKEKLALLKEHKKGLMQNLFPQAGEKVPKYRFPEFENDGEWEERKLGELCFNISSGKDKNSEAGEFELYGSTGIIGRTESGSYNGDYILAARVGANAGLLNRANGKFGVTDNTLVFEFKKNNSIDFLYFLLENIGLNKLVFGSGQPLITSGQLKNLQLLTPRAEKEQQRIAACLSSLDEIISAQKEQVEQLELHKKGLLQLLFP